MDQELAIWTTSLDYYATGEGRTMMARIGFARDEAQARHQFAESFDPFYAQGCEVEKGLIRNEVTRFLWSETALDYFEKISPLGAIEAQSSLHFNLS